eukprot:scaffold11559_cov67-Phaeocystis_antarctica.AAC.6
MHRIKLEKGVLSCCKDAPVSELVDAHCDVHSWRDPPALGATNSRAKEGADQQLVGLELLNTSKRHVPNDARGGSLKLGHAEVVDPACVDTKHSSNAIAPQLGNGLGRTGWVGLQDVRLSLDRRGDDRSAPIALSLL